MLPLNKKNQTKKFKTNRWTRRPPSRSNGTKWTHQVERRQIEDDDTKRPSRIIAFPLVLSTSTIFMLFYKLQILNGTGATRIFCKITKNEQIRILTACGPEEDSVKILNGVWARSTFCTFGIFGQVSPNCPRLPMETTISKKQKRAPPGEFKGSMRRRPLVWERSTFANLYNSLRIHDIIKITQKDASKSIGNYWPNTQ